MTEKKNAKSGVSLRPTANLGGFGFVLAVVWYSAASQNSAAAYLLLFALAAVFLVSIPHTFLNLGGLRARTESPKPTFAGQEVSVPVEITNQSRAGRRGLALSLADSNEAWETIDEIPAGKATRATLRFPATMRGEHTIARLCLASIYPLGLLNARKRMAAPQRYLVYPKPAGNPTLPASSARFQSGQPRNEIGEGDDFAGVRPYLLGESQRHIDWKAVARGQELMSKQFVVETNGLFYLDYNRVGLPNLEDRLSQLALWVIEAERAQLPYGLRLPNEEIRPALGDSHFHRCLRTLALFQ
jgi:uncharacterized protein (DUF58 family)